MIRISIEQLSLFDDEAEVKCEIAKQEDKVSANAISTRLLEAFSVSDIPFLGCDYDTVYLDLEGTIPGEKVVFDYPDIGMVIASEMICSAICHKINWDYLRYAVYKRTWKQTEWLKPESLINTTAYD